ncbi:MAG: hypothetical protein JW822_12410 [Spirochaetales bacterium]|nr:hypothetical protein [Spirochaetales bacterium]
MRKTILFLSCIFAFCISTCNSQLFSEKWVLKEVKKVDDLLDSKIGDDIIVSPDGTFIATVNRKEQKFILYEIDKDVKKGYPLPDSLARGIHYLTWSPDSRYIAVTENYVEFFHEPDIWIFDIETGVIKNHTDDGVDGGLFAADDVTVDWLPTWNQKDGDLYFIRSEKNKIQEKKWTITLCRISPQGQGKPESVVDITEVLPPFSLFQQPKISSNGSYLAIISYAKPDDPINGIWLINLQTSEIKQLLDMQKLKQCIPEWAGDAHSLIPFDLSWAADDKGLIIAMKSQGLQRYIPEQYYYINMATNDVKPLIDFNDIASEKEFYIKEENGHTPAFRIIRAGMLSSTGKTLFTLHFDPLSNAEDAMDNISVMSRQVPPDGTRPAFLGEIEFVGSPARRVERLIVPVSKTGYVCLRQFPYLLKFERE